MLSWQAKPVPATEAAVVQGRCCYGVVNKGAVVPVATHHDDAATLICGTCVNTVHGCQGTVMHPPFTCKGMVLPARTVRLSAQKIPAIAVV